MKSNLHPNLHPFATFFILPANPSLVLRGIFHCLLLVTLLAALAAPGGARAETFDYTPRERTWTTNGPVDAIVRTADTIYIGGEFTRVGRITGLGAPLDTKVGELAGAFPKVEGGNISACVSDGNGGWFIGGAFMRVGGVDRNNLAHILANGTLDPAWTTGSDSDVAALAIADGVVYVGGWFTSIGGKKRSCIAALDARTGDVKDWNPGAEYHTDGNTPSVNALAISDGVVYAGGVFTTIGGQERSCIAALDAKTGAVTAWNPGTDGEVDALAILNGVVYAGGYFTSIDGKARSCIAALNIKTGAATDWNPGADDWVLVLAISDGMLYAGGNFTNIGGKARSCIAVVDVKTGNATDWNPGADGWVASLAISDGVVYAGGVFSTIGGQKRNAIGAVDAKTGKATAWDSSTSGWVLALAISDGVVYAGGAFTAIGGTIRNNLAQVNAATGEVTAWNPSADGIVLALAVLGRTVYVGGAFTNIGGQNRNFIAALDTVTGIPTAWNPGASSYVEALAIADGVVYAGGSFTKIGGQNRNNIAALDAVTGVPTAWNPGADADVEALAASDGVVYAGGVFTNIGGQDRDYLAALDTVTGVPTAWNPGVGSYVDALAVSGRVVYVGGEFASINGQSRDNLAALDAITGTVKTWNPDPNGRVTALAVADGIAYIVGGFMYIGGTYCPSYAELSVSPLYDVTFQTDGTPGARLTGEATQSLTMGVDCTPVTAVAPTGYCFVKWTKGGAIQSTANPVTIRNVQADMTFVANFEKAYRVTFQTDGTPGATLSGAVTQAVGLSAGTPVTANAPVGYHFVKWTRSGADFSTANPLRVSNATGDMTLTAVFAINTYLVTFQTDGTPGATLIGEAAQTVAYGATCTPVTANVPRGYDFVNWTKGSLQQSAAKTVTIRNVRVPMTFVANYKVHVNAARDWRHYD